MGTSKSILFNNILLVPGAHKYSSGARTAFQIHLASSFDKGLLIGVKCLKLKRPIIRHS